MFEEQADIPYPPVNKSPNFCSSPKDCIFKKFIILSGALALEFMLSNPPTVKPRVQLAVDPVDLC